ncbi:MAG: transporter [Verrucomicrobia bacterium]|nr:transporter [Verrucomicrobiota bacterium]
MAPLTLLAQEAGEAADEYINPDRPGLADGSNVVGVGRFQIETGFQQEFRRRQEHSQTQFFPTLLRLGVSRALELRVEGNTYTRSTADISGSGSTTSRGFAPTSFGAKYHFVDGDGFKQPSIGAIVRVFPPSGTGDFRTFHTTGDFRLAADWDFAPQWSLNPNIGIGSYQDSTGPTYRAGIFALTLNYNPSKTLNFFLDAGAQTPEAKHGKTAVTVDAGCAYIIGKNIQLDVSVGTRVVGRTPPEPFIAAGFSKRF